MVIDFSQSDVPNYWAVTWTILTLFRFLLLNYLVTVRQISPLYHECVNFGEDVLLDLFTTNFMQL